MVDQLPLLMNELPKEVRLIAVSKTRSVQEILEIYNKGIRDFGENKVQEMISKQLLLPQDIRWHLIGHLQTNKVKFITSFVSIIHSVDSLKLLKEINQQAIKSNRIVDCLLQIYIASEDTKFGLSFDEAILLLRNPELKNFENVRITGLMGMASFTTDTDLIRKEFRSLKEFFIILKKEFFKEDNNFKELSMGMSSDYKIAVEEGSSMVRIGTAIFGERNYNKN